MTVELLVSISIFLGIIGLFAFTNGVRGLYRLWKDKDTKWCLEGSLGLLFVVVGSCLIWGTLDALALYFTQSRLSEVLSIF